MVFSKRKYYSSEEIETIRESALIVGKTLGEVAKHIKPGIPLIMLDRIAEEYIRSQGAIPSFKGYQGFPASLCISVNDVVVHGIPNNNILKEGDIVSIDCGACKNGYHGDYAYTFAVGQISEEKRLLLERTKESLLLGIAEVKIGNTTGDIGAAVQSYAENFGYGVVRELCGHGIGKNMHEMPDVPNYGVRGHGTRLVQGMVICIEPMITMGKRNITMDQDGWTIRTRDGLPAAHFEHQVALTANGTELLSTYEYIEESLNSNK